MRRAPVLAAVAVLVVGVAAMVPAWLLKERDTLAVTPQPPAVEQLTELQLGAGVRTCMDLVALDEHSDVARIGPVEGRPQPLELTIEGEGGYRARARSGDYESGSVVALEVPPPPASVEATMCLRNLGERPVALAAVQDRRRSRSAVLLDGNAAPVSWAVSFAEREPVSILDRLPESMARMSVLRPAFVSEATLWGLLILFVAAIPVLAIWAFARAVGRDDG